MKKHNTENYIIFGAIAIGVGLVIKHFISAFDRDDNVLSKETSKILSNPNDKKILLDAIDKIETDEKVDSEEITLSSGKKMEIVM